MPCNVILCHGRRERVGEAEEKEEWRCVLLPGGGEEASRESGGRRGGTLLTWAFTQPQELAKMPVKKRTPWVALDK